MIILMLMVGLGGLSGVATHGSPRSLPPKRTAPRGHIYRDKCRRTGFSRYWGSSSALKLPDYSPKEDLLSNAGESRTGRASAALLLSEMTDSKRGSSISPETIEERSQAHPCPMKPKKQQEPIELSPKKSRDPSEGGGETPFEF